MRWRTLISATSVAIEYAEYIARAKYVEATLALTKMTRCGEAVKTRDETCPHQESSALTPTHSVLFWPYSHLLLLTLFAISERDQINHHAQYILSSEQCFGLLVVLLVSLARCYSIVFFRPTVNAWAK
jgi:hypothetical protein